MASQITEAELKSSIKSLLTSTTDQTTIRTLERDFAEMIGNRIPFSKFGFNSVEHLLKSIPDTCVVQGTGPFAKVFLVHSEKSNHMNALVSRQKVNTKKRGRPPRRYKAPIPMPPIFRGGFQNLNYAMSPNTSYSSESSYSYNNGGSVALKLMAYTNSPNNQINNTNFNSNQNVQLTTTSKTSNTSFNNQNTQTKISTEIKTATPTRPLQNGSGTQSNKNILNNLIKEKPNLAFVETESSKHIESVATEVDLPNTRTQSSKRYVENWIKAQIPACAETVDSLENVRSESAKQNVENWIRDSYQKPSSKEIIEPFETLRITTTNKDEPELSAFDKIKEDMDSDNSSVPNKVQDRLRELIGKFPEGIWVSELPKHYQTMFRRELFYTNYGYASLIEMCVALKHIFHYARPGKDDFKLYDKSKPLPETAEKLYTMASYDTRQKKETSKRVPEALPELDWSDFLGHIPEDICRLGRTIPRQFLPEDVLVETVMEVVVVEAYDPSKFWIYLGTSQEETELDSLMEELQCFYCHEDTAKKYAIPPGLIKENLYCVQFIYGDYHRALIVQVYREEEYVKVFCIDYGSTVRVPMKGLCFLHNKFSELPAQAIRCSLANIIPTIEGHPWSHTAKDRFRELVNRRETKINISHIDYEQLLVYVFLADVTKPENIVYINHELVKEKHARWDKEVQDTPLLMTNLTCKVKNLHLFPTHDELEHGTAPSVTEIYSLDDMLVPLNFYLPQYFTHNNQDQLIENKEQIAKQIDPSYIKTVSTKHSTRNFAKWTNALANVHKPVIIDLSLFNDLEASITDFYKSSVDSTIIKNQEGKQLAEEDLFCDVDDDVSPDNTENKSPSYAKYSRKDLNISDNDKELPNSVVTKLTDYKLLEEVSSSQSETRNSTNQSFDGLLPHISELSEEDAKTSSGSRPSTVRRPRLYSETKPVTKPFEEVNIFDNPEAFQDGTNYITDEISTLSPFGFLSNIETSSATSSGSTNFIKFDSDYSCDSLEKSATICATATSPNLPETVVVKRQIDSIMDATIDKFKVTNDYGNSNLLDLACKKWPFNDELSDTNPFKQFLTSNALTIEEPVSVQEIVDAEKRSPVASSDLFSSAVSHGSDESDYKSFEVSNQASISDYPKSVVSPQISPCSNARLDAENGSSENSLDNMSSVSVKSSLTATAAEFKPRSKHQQSPYPQWSSGHYHPQQQFHTPQPFHPQHPFHPQQPFHPRSQVHQFPEMPPTLMSPPLMSPQSNPYGMPRPPPGFHYPVAYYQEEENKYGDSWYDDCEQQQQSQSFANFMSPQMNSAPRPAMYPGFYNGQHLIGLNNHVLPALTAPKQRDFYDVHNEHLIKNYQNNGNKLQ